MKYYRYSEFAKIANISIRTLRWYEKIGLLEPMICEDVRYLCEQDFLKLQSIQLLHEAKYTLQEIKQILSTKDIKEHILLQKELLQCQSVRIQSMLALIDQLETNHDLPYENLYDEFYKLHTLKNIELQFAKPNHLQKRIEFHHHYTSFQENFHQWMFQHYQFHKAARILDVGCGDGTIWLENKEVLPNAIEITMSDISKDMIKTAQEQLKELPQFHAFDVADCRHLPYEDDTFDCILANHLFMYFDDLDEVFLEIKRVLKQGGILYCSTIASDMMKERDELLLRFDPHISFHQEVLCNRFGYEKGEERLSQYFQNIHLYDRKEQYHVHDGIDRYYEFILSGQGLSNELDGLFHKKEEFYQFMEREYEKQQGFLLTIHAGMFSCQKVML